MKLKFRSNDLEFEKSKVYVYCDPRYSGNYVYEFEGGVLRLKSKPFYIGCAKRNRLLRHFENSGLITKRINKIKKDGLEPIIKILRIYNSRKKALKLEEKLIVLIGRQDLKMGPLLNKADGGLGTKNPNKKNRRKQRKVSTENAKQQWKNPTFREMHIIKGRKQWESLEYRKEMSRKFKEAWNRPGYKLSHSGENNGRAKLTKNEVLEIREVYKRGGFFQEELAKIYGVSQASIQRIVTEFSWNHLKC